MLLKIILLLTIVPLVELILLVRIAEATSLSFTLLLVIGTGILGGVLAKLEGLRVWVQIQKELRYGRLPANSLFDGALVLVAGAFLLTPGVLTDAVGFLLLLPPTRAGIREYLKKKLKKRIRDGNVHFYSEMGFGPIRHEPPPGSPPIENDDVTTGNEEEDGED